MLDARTIASKMGGKIVNGHALVPGPGHSAHDRSLSIKPDASAPDGFVCHSFSGDDFTQCRDYVKARLGLPSEPSPEYGGNKTTNPHKNIVATYRYEDERGEVLFEVVRLNPKDFRQRRPDGRGGWAWNLDGVRRIPYRLPELIEAIASGYIVVVVEGEKDVEALRQIGVNPTTFPGGAGKWRQEYGAHFEGADVVIIPDNDDVGRDHARQVAGAIESKADRVRIVDIGSAWPQCPVKGDVSDWLAAGGTREQLDKLFEAAPNTKEWIACQQGADGQNSACSGQERSSAGTFTADALQKMTFPQLTYLLPGLIPEGLCLLVSRPKLGKSWLVLDVAIATAASRFVLGELQPVSGEVLYLALEDGPRRLQRRMDRLLPTFSGTWPEGITFATEWPRSDQGGLSNIEEWIKKTIEKGKHPRLVIVDTLAQFRKMATGKSVYLEDYTAISELQKLASKYNVTIIVVHHDRKGGADDVFDTVSGSLGLTGAADTIAIMKREAGSVTLHVRGRDVEETEKALQFNKDTCRWTMLGEASEVRRSDERSRVLGALQEAGGPLTTSEIISLANLVSRNAADNLLLRMVRDEVIERVGRGLYSLPGANERAPRKKREIREKDRSQPKILMEQTDNAQSIDLTHLTQFPADADRREMSLDHEDRAQ
jgi:hypothetical protein